MDLYCLEFDGASKGNPGKAGAGAVLRRPDGSVLCELMAGLGVSTCNVAEYRACIMGLQGALDRGIRYIKVQGDSSLVCKQINEEWRVHNKDLLNLWTEAKMLKNNFKQFSIQHVAREFNSAADALANSAVALPETKFSSSHAKNVIVDLKSTKDDNPKSSQFEMEECRRDVHQVSEAVSAPAKDDVVISLESGMLELASECTKATEFLFTVDEEKRNVYQLEYDGSTQSSSGKAGIGALLRCPNGSVQMVLKEGLGIATCHAAHYHALIVGLRAALDCGVTHIQVQGNSSLVFKQMTGKSTVQNKNLMTLWKEADELRKEFQQFTITHVHKKLNGTANALASSAINLPEAMFMRAGFHQNSRRQYSTIQNFGNMGRYFRRTENLEHMVSVFIAQPFITPFLYKALHVSSYSGQTWQFNKLSPLRSSGHMVKLLRCT
eukprot:c26314_g1_i3 orf=627-1937(-)